MNSRDVSLAMLTGSIILVVLCLIYIRLYIADQQRISVDIERPRPDRVPPYHVNFVQ